MRIVIERLLCGGRPRVDAPAGQRGAVFLFFVVVLPVIMGFLGLSLDFGVFMLTKRTTQIAADAGAKAASLEIPVDDGALVQPVAEFVAALNGHPTSNSTVVANHPPLSGRRTGDNNFVEVIVSRAVPTSFLGYFGLTGATVSSRAVAGLGGGSPNCIYILDETAKTSFLVGGGGLVDSGCGIKVNSCDSSAASVTGGSIVISTGIDVCGQYIEGGGGYFDPTPQTGIDPVDDPLAWLDPPDFDPKDCDFTSTRIDGVATLSPGTYCAGIEIKSGSVVNFLPGEYYLVGYGLQATGGATLTGDNVFFYNTFDPTSVIKEAQNPNLIELGGGGSMDFSAPTSGYYEGILFFTDRAADSDIKNDISGGSTTNLEGIFYAANQRLRYGGGGGNTAAYTGIVVRELELSGGSTFTDDYSGP